MDDRVPELKPYDPTIRERLSSGLQSGLEALGMKRYGARRAAQTVTGGPSSNLPLGMGAADFIPFVGTGLQTEEAARDLGKAYQSAKQGDYVDAAVEGGFGLLGMVPGVAATAKTMRAAGKTAPKAVPKVEAAPKLNITKPEALKPMAAPDQPKLKGKYETTQEGPYYRVRPTGDEASGRRPVGIHEEVRPAPEGGSGSVGSELPQSVSDEQIREMMADPGNFVRKTADDYAQRYTGSPYELPKIPESSLAKQSAIGRTFQLAAEDDPKYKSAVFDAYAKKYPDLVESTGAQNYDQLMEAAYRQLAMETEKQFRSLPINMSYHRQGEGNYTSSGQMLKDIYGNRHMYVYQGGDPHDFLNAIDPQTGLNTNEMFRAVHDFYGHAIHGNQFGPKGEEVAWAAHSKMFSPLARIAMTSETRGQNSFVNYTPLNAELKAQISKLDEAIMDAKRHRRTEDVKMLEEAKKGVWAEFQFAPQKSVILPPEYLDLDYKGGMPGYIQPLIKPEAGTTAASQLTHFSHSPDIEIIDPSRYGTGIKGREMERLTGSMNPVMERSYFYTGEPGSVRPEPGLGIHRYGARSEGLYDVSADPMNFRKLATEANRTPFTAKYNQGVTDPTQSFTDVERMAKEYGYEGLMNPQQGTAIMYKPTPVQRYSWGGFVEQPQGVVAPYNTTPDMADGGRIYPDNELNNYAAGGLAHFDKGGRAKQEVKEWLRGAIDSLTKKFADDASKANAKPIATESVISSTISKSADEIAKANPKLSEAEIAKKAERDALAKLKWERQEKPAIESRYGKLARSSYDDPRAKRLRNVPEVVEERARKAEEFLAQPTEPWTPPKPELQAFDRSLIKDALEGFPGVEQSRFPRYEPARADTGYIDEIYNDPRNRALIEKQIKRGLPLGGETFYASLYPLKVAAMERGISPQKFESFVYETAPASARNSIMNEMAVGQFLRDMNARGLPLDEKTVAEEMAKFKSQYGTGLPLMPVHREGVRQVIEGGQNMRDMVKADIPTNYKIPTYGTQKAGDFGKSMVLDVHESAGQTQGSRYHPYFTEQGGFGPTEYGLAESKMLDIANEMGIPGGMAQAGRWFGGGELTGLKSPRGDALDLLERQAAYTMQGLGIKPTPKMIREYILDMIESGRGVLMPYYKSEAIPDYRTQKKKGGAVRSGLSALEHARA